MTIKSIWLEGLWDRNPGLIQLLGLCPLLAVSNTLENAIALGLATLLVLVFSNASISLIRHLVNDNVRLPVFVLVIGALTTCAELLVQAFDYSLYKSLGIFLPLIVTNCLILGRAEALARRENFFVSTMDGLAQGLGFFLVLIILGALRESLSGTLILVALPPGAFLTLGLLVAIHQSIQNYLSSRLRRSSPKTKRKRRVRTTGEVS